MQLAISEISILVDVFGLKAGGIVHDDPGALCETEPVASRFAEMRGNGRLERV